MTKGQKLYNALVASLTWNTGNAKRKIKRLFCKHCYLVEFKNWADKDGISHVTRIEQCSKCGHILYEKELK